MRFDVEAGAEKYAIRESPTGRWEVYDTLTGHVVVLSGSPLWRLYVEEAREAAELLNAEHANQITATIH